MSYLPTVSRKLQVEPLPCCLLHYSDAAYLAKTQRSFAKMTRASYRTKGRLKFIEKVCSKHAPVVGKQDSRSVPSLSEKTFTQLDAATHPSARVLCLYYSFRLGRFSCGILMYSHKYARAQVCVV